MLWPPPAPRTSAAQSNAGFKAADAQLPSPHSFVKLSCCDAIDHFAASHYNRITAKQIKKFAARKAGPKDKNNLNYFKLAAS